jgi:eukaryotic-like serine/threonine-protein kinase
MGDRGEVAARDAESTEEVVPEAIKPEVIRANERIGRTLRDKWRLDSLLGVGGMAAVYAATHRNGSRAAVKVLHEGMSSNPFVRPRFLWEGYLANAVGHDGALKVIDDDEAEDGSLFLVTELLDGETLEERRMRFGGRLPCDEVLLAIDQVLSVLAAAHAKGVVHRDLKPENVFLTRAGRIKVLDFGIARLRQLPAADGPAESENMIGGTPSYMAPEQAAGPSDAVDDRSDLWACGATMFCLLSGRTVNEGATSYEQLTSATSRLAPSLRSVAPDVPARVGRLVDRALEFSKEKRWPNATSMQSALREVYHHVGGHPISEASKIAFARDVPAHTRQKEPSSPPTGSAGPVALSYRLSRRPMSPIRKRAVALGGAVGLLLVTGVLLLTGGHTEGRAQATSSSMPKASPENATQASTDVVKLQPLSPPALSVPDGPLVGVASTSAARKPPPSPASLAAPSVPAPSASAPSASAPSASASSVSAPSVSAPSMSAPSVSAPSMSAPSVQPACEPPYVVDATTGKKHWKLECL